ncbi:MAG: hypothetical protein CBE21_00725 [Proteobacteria bacterium TMED261]|nr:MAG: hypothetical protein CBE21_00725 [Proteobacteria bacterium TMED261]|tara:strand:- start:146 stop:610 length:465 start_codon:yes stop_codon:yes gene_type:complete
MNQYRYLKLRNGEDIIAITSVKEDTGTVEMTLPCNVGLNPSVTGKGTVIKLSPLVPFTKDNKIIIAATEVVYTTSVDDKFIAFYDKAMKDWVQLRDEVGLDVMSPKEELDRGSDTLAHLTNLMKQERLLPEDELSLEEEMDLMEYEESQKKILH